MENKDYVVNGVVYNLNNIWNYMDKDYWDAKIEDVLGWVVAVDVEVTIYLYNTFINYFLDNFLNLNLEEQIDILTNNKYLKKS